jgi:hypothetical protein
MSEVRKWLETIGLAQYPHIVAGVSVYLIVLALITFVSAIGAPASSSVHILRATMSLLLPLEGRR